MTITDQDRAHLRRAVDLAEEALESGDEPFGSVLVSSEGVVLAEDRNRVITHEDATAHPEIALARWAGGHVPVDARARCVVYTSGEHCAMCSAAHAWVGLGRIVIATTHEQLGGWLSELGVAPGPVAPLGIQSVAPGVAVDGPVPELAERVRGLHVEHVARRRSNAAR